MIRVVIIEDELPAREKLKRFLDEVKESIEVVAEISTVETAVEFLRNSKVDLVISDIELQDGNAFEVYGQIALTCPIIFTTAYDQFWMNAFETNGIDYLLKPFSKDRFQKAWDKFVLLRETESDKNQLLENLSRLIEDNLATKKFRKRFTVHTRTGVHFLDTDSIVYFEANDGVILAYDNLGKKHLLNYSTLKEIETQLDPACFFKINRSELISKQHIEKMERYNKNTLAIKMKGYTVVLKTSQSITAELRSWIEE